MALPCLSMPPRSLASAYDRFFKASSEYQASEVPCSLTQIDGWRRSGELNFKLREFDMPLPSLALRVTALCLSAVSWPAFSAETATYSYDALGRLITTTMSGTINNGQTTIVNYDAAGNRTCLSTSTATSTTPTLSICDVWVAEGGVLTFVVTRKGNAATVVGASWTSANGSATGGSTASGGNDYQSGSGILSFAAGQTSQLIKIITWQDTIDESNETVTVTLSSPTGGAALGDATATGWIVNND